MKKLKEIYKKLEETFEKKTVFLEQEKVFAVLDMIVLQKLKIWDISMGSMKLLKTLT